MTELSDEWTFRRVVWTTLIFVMVAVSFWILYRYYAVVFILFIAIVVGTAIRPVVDWLFRRGIPRLAGVILIYFLFFALIIGFGFLLFPLIAEQSGKISSSLLGYYQTLRVWMVNNPSPIIARLSVSLPATLQIFTPIQQSGTQILATAEQVLGYLISAIDIIFMAVAILLLSVHWTLNGPRTIQSLMLLVPMDKRETINELISAIESKVGSFINGQVILCSVIGVLALVAYLLIGLPNAFVLALVAGVLEAVPMVGPILGAIPAAVIALSISPTKVIYVIGATIVIQQLENNLLVPRVMHRAVGVNPFVSLLAIFAFTSLFGIAGALIAIPVAVIIQLLLDRFVFSTSALESEVSEGRDYTSRLRYEAQDLAQDLQKQARLKKSGSDQQVMQIDQLMDEIEAITTDLDALLAQTNIPGEP